MESKKGVGVLVILLVLACAAKEDGNAVIQSQPTPANPPGKNTLTADFWLTNSDKTVLLTKTAIIAKSTTSPIIEVDTTQRFQTIDGFGYTLTGGSAYLINQKLSSSQQDALLKELFLPDVNSIGISYLRISIGASDLDASVFSYCDLPQGQTDVALSNFTIAEDLKNLVPVLKKIVALNPTIKIMGSPWSAPMWMKTNNSSKGGTLKQEYYSVYANYFVKYIHSMAQQGISVDAITPQNEPEHPGNNPSMTFTPEQQKVFVRDHLGPAFKKAGIKTKIVIYDHNCDHPEYPISILTDGTAREFVDGSAFHLYAGDISALSTVRNAHPDKNIYFTEQWTSGNGKFNEDLVWGTKNLIVGASRNWAKAVLQWNLASDPQFGPHTDGGCTLCLGAITIGSSVTRNVAYYTIAHAAKFVPAGSVRVKSNLVDNLPNVAFQTPQGKKVLIVVNDGSVYKDFVIMFKGKRTSATLPAGGVGTFVW
jgi:glucosylceramidase